MPELSILASPAPYHIVSYGTLLGSSIFQSFISGVVAYKVLPRPQFSVLQQATVPIYFSMQTALPVILALTYPGEASPLGRIVPSGIRGLLTDDNRWSAAIPIATMFATSLINLVWLGPMTTKVMRQRKHQETKDGKKYYESPPHSQEMTRMNKAFARLHGMSALSNMVGLFAMVWYGVSLAERIR